MLGRFLENRNQIKVKVEVCPHNFTYYEGAKYFDYTIFILRYLQLALKNKIVFSSKNWNEHESLKSEIEESINDLYLREKEPEEYEKIYQQENNKERELFSSYKFQLKEDDWDKSENSELWYCKSALKKLFLKYHIHHETYFRNLENLLEFIELKGSILNISKELLKHYSKIISSNMSQNELATLFYYAALFEKFQKSCVNLQFFERLDSCYLLDKSHAVLIRGITIKNTQEHYDSQKTTV